MIINPIRLLGTAFTILLLSLIVLIFFEFGYFESYKDLEDIRKAQSANAGIVTAGVIVAAMGWMVTSMVTIRNSVKQHTINTLLQTRLSSTYMAEADQINKFFAGKGYSAGACAPLSVIESDEKTLKAIDYILNFLEFMAVGIKHGDLQEMVLKDAMRGIVVTFTKITQRYIDHCRGVGPGKIERPRAYQNLLWLRDRWDD